MKKIILFIVLLNVCVLPVVQAQDEQPTVSPSVKSFALQPDIIGSAANSVNLFTGNVLLPLSLVSLPGHGGLDVNLSITYNSNNIHKQVGVWNAEAPTGVLGLGWSMEIPKIVSDHKNTGTREDDTYYILEGGSSNRLIRNNSGFDPIGVYYGYETKNYQFWKIRYYYTLERWEITRENGVKYVYGDKNSTRSTLQYLVRWENWIGNSAQTAGQIQMPYIWNISEIVSMSAEKVLFQYETVEQFVGSTSGKKHTQASYLKQITDVFGRKVIFFYNEKSSNYYAETHTEKTEPDAYQEFYETRYLDHIDVLKETGTKFIGLQFGYTNIDAASNTAKMLLSSIIQTNQAGRSLPGTQFSYYTSGATKGFLQTVTFREGGTTSYTYTPSTITRANRKLTISAPAGYAEPKVWTDDDYVVVAWRELGTGGSHDSSPKIVKLYVYQWVGEWKEQFLQTIHGVSLENTTYTTYKNFQVVTQPRFFGVLTGGNGNNNYTLFIRHKDEINRGSWGHNTRTIDYGDGIPYLVGGENFLFVGGFRDDGTHPSYRFLFQGNSWDESTLNQTIGDHYYTGTNNYFLSHNRAGFDGNPELNFNYLNEEHKWTTKNLPYSWLLFSSDDKSYWHGANSYAVAMADNNPEYIYQWDATYTNFSRADVIGSYSDNSFVFNINNSAIGILQPTSSTSGKLMRYNGQTWLASANFGAYWQHRVSFGEDYAIWTVDDRDRPVRGYLRTYNPNTMAFSDMDISYTPNETLFGNTYGHNAVRAGSNFFSFTDKIYFRKPNGTWSPDYTLTTPSGTNIQASSIKVGNQYFVYRNTAGTVTVQFIKNGVISTTDNISGIYESNVMNMVSANTIVTGLSSLNNATSLNLYRIMDQKAGSAIIDYPVSLLTVNDGTQNRYTSFEYNLAKACVDPSGTIAQYNEVTVIPGSNSPASKPNGYTKHFFHNGMTAEELGISYIPVDLPWAGLEYENSSYDINNNLVVSAKTTYLTFSRNINNSDNTKVEIGYYVRPYQMRSISDGIETLTSNSHDNNTGLISSQTAYDYDSKNNAANLTTFYTYYWQAYDVTREKNILSPIIQEKKVTYKNGQEIVLNLNAVTWKNWGTLPAPHKTYLWKRTGTPVNFDFTSWSGTGEPPADWLKISEIERDAIGNLTQITTR